MVAILALLLALGLVASASAPPVPHDFQWMSEKGVRDWGYWNGAWEPITVGGTLSDLTTARYFPPGGGEWGAVDWDYQGSTYRIAIDPFGGGGLGSVPIHLAAAGSPGDIAPSFEYTGSLQLPTTFTLGASWGSMGEFLIFHATGTRIVPVTEPSPAGLFVLLALLARVAGRSSRRPHP